MELCPKGIDIFFDNVGGDILDAALARLAMRGRVVLCGGIANYNATEPPPGPKNYLNRVAFSKTLCLHVNSVEAELIFLDDAVDASIAGSTELCRCVLAGPAVAHRDQ